MRGASVSGTETVLLGAIAGLTIFLGLPVGRMRGLSIRTRALLNAGAAGVLIFLFSEVVESGLGPIDVTLEHAVKGSGSWFDFAAHAVVYGVLFAAGLVGLVYYDRWLLRRRSRPGVPFGPGSAAVDEYKVRKTPAFLLSDPKRLAFFIALGIGFHNLSEGLAIGQSAATGQISLALLLIIGFGLHNATEGFGIVAPMAAEGVVPSWGFLGLLGLIGGGPTFVGTIVGQAWVNDWLFVAFLGMAAGSILYVVIELLGVARKLGHKEIMTWGILLGLFLGFATDMVLVAAGT